MKTHSRNLHRTRCRRSIPRLAHRMARLRPGGKSSYQVDRRSLHYTLYPRNRAARRRRMGCLPPVGGILQGFLAPVLRVRTRVGREGRRSHRRTPSHRSMAVPVSRMGIQSREVGRIQALPSLRERTWVADRGARALR